MCTSTSFFVVAYYNDFGRGKMGIIMYFGSFMYYEEMRDMNYV